MTKKLLLILPLLVGPPFLLTGALRRPPIAPVAPFTAEPVVLAANLDLSGQNAGQVLDQALARCAPDRLTWLHVKLWQRMAAHATTFESEGTLQLGPNHCARLDLTVFTGVTPGRWLVISDGHAIAQVTQFGSEAPTAVSQLLAPPPEPDQPAPLPPAQTLSNLGCGGPYALLSDLRMRLKELTTDTGRLQGRPVVRLRGRLDPAPPSPQGATDRADFCYLYLDAQTLWPSRIEWWVADGRRGSRLLLEMEYRDPQLNRPLSMPECIRAFSYKPQSQ
jgi:hypothetical protein